MPARSILDGPTLPRWEPPRAFEEYRIVRLLGHGAMGRVYLAHDALLDRPVAIKFLGAMEVGDSARERFFTEARAVARLSHPNVVAVHRVGQVRRRPYLVSEYVRGLSLDRFDKPVPWERILKIGIGLARGLASAHRGGVLHRDIKPANVVIADGDQAKLLDFGLAKLLDAAASGVAESDSAGPRMEAAEAGTAATLSIAGAPDVTRRRDSSVSDMKLVSAGSPLTAIGAMVGTPLYMAPELWRGEPASRQSDLYALGVLLYELACGRPPHADVSLAELGRRAQEEDAPPIASCAAGLPVALADLIDSCLRRDPLLRPESGDALCERLDVLARRYSQEPASEAIEQPPFRRLASFTEADRRRFHGRDRELAVLAEQVLFRRTVVFTAPSGTGKSSLLRAGLQPRLEEMGIRVVYVSSRTEPASTIIAALAPGTATVAGAVTAWSARNNAKLVIILDQIETLLGQRPVDAAGDVLDDVIALGRDGSAPLVSIVIAVREDFLARVLAYTQRPDDAVGPIVRLGPMTLEGAREAIARPLADRRLEIEPALLDMLLTDLANAAAMLGQELGWGGEAAVYPPHLQIACSVLYEALAPGESTLTIDHYRRLGGFDAIVGEHLDRVVETELSPETAAIARDLFLTLVTAAHTRAARTEAELLHAVTRPGAAGRVPEVLEVLRTHGLLVRTGRSTGEPVWELIHDSLVPRVQGWIDRHDIARRRALELVRYHLRRSSPEAPSLLSRAELRELAPHPEALRDLDAEWARRSAVSRIVDPGAWTPRALVARSRRAIRRKQAVGFGLTAIAAAMMTALIVDRRAAAAAERREQSLRDRDLGRFILELAPFDWNVTTLTPSDVAVAELPALDWTLRKPDPDDRDSPGPQLDGSRLIRSAPSSAADGHAKVERVEAPGGPAFLVISGRGRGDDCMPAIVPLRSLPGYAGRGGLAPRLRIRVPTCQATRAGLIEIPAGPFISGGVGEPPSPVQASYRIPESVIEQARFAIDRTEVSNGHFRVLAEMATITGISAPVYADTNELSAAGGADRPVTSIGWVDARAFCRFLGRRLPTSAEWQKAARGGLVLADGRPNPHPRRNLPWADDRRPVPANINRGVDVGPAPVGAFPGDVSPYGVLDLAGNVQEWTSSTDEMGLSITRGGNWAETTPEATIDYAAITNPRPAGLRAYMLGFRCASD